MAAAPAHYSRRRTTVASLRLSILQFMADPQWLVPSMIAPIVFGVVSFELFRGYGPVLPDLRDPRRGDDEHVGPDALRERLGDKPGPELRNPRAYHPVPLTVPCTSSSGRVLWNVVSGLIGGLIVYAVVVLAAGEPPALSNPIGFARDVRLRDDNSRRGRRRLRSVLRLHAVRRLHPEHR